MLSSVSFRQGSETVKEGDGTFAIPVTVSGTPAINTFVSGIGAPTALAFSPVPPTFMGEQRVYSQKGKHKTLVGFEVVFNSALDAGAAQSTGDYHVTQKLGKKVKVLPVTSALYNPSNFSVTISVSGFKTGTAAQVTIAGLAGANGEAIPQIMTGL